ncbi:MAG: glycoside hydrolase family 20 zincin-like fold domain-containing protein [Halanaerobiales bacterium]
MIIIFILPEPREIELADEGYFLLSPESKIILDFACNFADLDAARLLQSEINSTIAYKMDIIKSLGKDLDLSNKPYIYLKREKKEAKAGTYKLSINEKRIEIKAFDDAGLFYGVQSLRQLFRQFGSKLPALIIEDNPYFHKRGFYHDITRGKVPTLDTLKELADRLSFYKINQLQLYVEHSFAFQGMDEVWVDKDPLSAEEILIFDEYCQIRHIELVPSLSTFGHLYEALRSKSFRYLAELEIKEETPYSWVERQRHYTLDVSNSDSFAFVRDMLDQYIPLFSSKKFNICCDETFDLGKGKNMGLAKRVGKDRLYLDFLNKIIKYLQGFDKEVMFWGDIILEHPNLLDELPEDVTCLNWEYNALADENKVKTVARSGIRQYICPGVAGWNSLMNDMDIASLNISRMIAYGRKYNASGILNTDWGDYGHINLLANSMPGMILGASLSWNPDMIDSELLDNDNKLLEYMEEIDELISKIEFKDRKGEIVGILRDLSRQQLIDWGMIIRWQEEKFKGIEKAFYDRDRFLKLSIEDIRKAYDKSFELSEKIHVMGANIINELALDFEEFYISARGIAHINALGLIIKKYDFKQNCANLIVSPGVLAGELEAWLSRYKKIWRKRNKESELARIVEAIKSISTYLRKLN